MPKKSPSTKKPSIPEITLGCIARDSITGSEGVVVAKTDWLNGCVRYLIQPQQLKDGKSVEPESFDAQQVVFVRASYRENAPIPRATGGPFPSPTRAKDPQ